MVRLEERADALVMEGVRAGCDEEGLLYRDGEQTWRMIISLTVYIDGVAIDSQMQQSGRDVLVAGFFPGAPGVLGIAISFSCFNALELLPS